MLQLLLSLYLLSVLSHCSTRILNHCNIFSSFVFPCHYFQMNSVLVILVSHQCTIDNHLHMYMYCIYIYKNALTTYVDDLQTKWSGDGLYIVIICYYNSLRFHTHVKCYICYAIWEASLRFEYETNHHIIQMCLFILPFWHQEFRPKWIDTHVHAHESRLSCICVCIIFFF